MARKRFTERQVILTLLNQGALIFCARCNRPFLPKDVDQIEREHIFEIALGGQDEPDNCCYSHSECHKIVTDGTKVTTAGSSKNKIAKLRKKEKREAGEKKKYNWPKRKLRGRKKERD